MEPQKILIVEDDPVTCTLLKTTLELEGYQVSYVYSVEDEDVVLLLNKENPDILFLDFHLGATRTLPYIELIRKNTDWQNLPILMTSAIDYSQECLAAGANDFIVKPFKWEDLTKKVDDIQKS